MSNMTIFVCSNCNKPVKGGDKEFMEKHNNTECAECRFHAANGSRTIEGFNKWLKGGDNTQ